jgi:alpha-L-rhamnosidase
LKAPFVANSEYDGEEYDVRREQEGWADPGFDNSHWQKARRVNAPGGVLMSQMAEPVRVTQTMRPVAMMNPKPGAYVLDMGQSFYGVARLKVFGPCGTRVEMLEAWF